MDRLVDDYLAGFSVGLLAQKYGVHRATVSKHLTRRGIDRHQPGLNADDAALAARLHREGASMRGIVHALGCNRKHVRAALVEAGLIGKQREANSHRDRSTR